MGNYVLTEQLPSPEVFNRLRSAVGWPKLNEKLLEKALNDSIFSICALLENRTIGMGRIIGDGALYFYIQDLIVLPECQGMGVGSAMLQRLMELLETKTSEGSFVGLMAARESEAFYKKFGFIERPNGHFGPGMCKYK
ncbi:GNAT family N-acetyltransferase [Phosphitispora fastidiosa]|uniref:GNAT family N-acetyltransferase n=1 Tax=Phosphitispora fastidiosa TaxID=2837202 RepID=UPI001E5AA359|nr:GNAT family N-acetyltransferase [Phosphitispora fastidiosa]MBU7007735.1 ribosomal protein S18 acetylase RimI-like enzyme [Phosphitispora fastidiosa]